LTHNEIGGVSKADLTLCLKGYSVYCMNRLRRTCHSSGREGQAHFLGESVGHVLSAVALAEFNVSIRLHEKGDYG
jgi:hypothetical protein